MISSIDKEEESLDYILLLIKSDVNSFYTAKSEHTINRKAHLSSLDVILKQINNKITHNILSTYLKEELNWKEKNNPNRWNSFSLPKLYTLDTKEGIVGEINKHYIIEFYSCIDNNLEVYERDCGFYRKDNELIFKGLIETKEELKTLLNQLGVYGRE